MYVITLVFFSSIFLDFVVRHFSFIKLHILHDDGRELFDDLAKRNVTLFILGVQ